MIRAWIFVFMLLPGAAALAGEVEIVSTEFVRNGGAWTVHTTLRHGDTGWSHYADAWRVVAASGEVLATRTLHHPHVEEQPFTRSLGAVTVPRGETVVYVEAHDKVHGWSRQRVRVDLSRPRGERFKVSQ